MLCEDLFLFTLTPTMTAVTTTSTITMTMTPTIAPMMMPVGLLFGAEVLLLVESGSPPPDPPGELHAGVEDV